MNYTVELHSHTYHETVKVYTLGEASAVVTAWQAKHGYGCSDLSPGHGDVIGPDSKEYQVSFNGRVWSKDDDGDFAVLEHEPVD